MISPPMTRVVSQNRSYISIFVATLDDSSGKQRTMPTFDSDIQRSLVIAYGFTADTFDPELVMLWQNGQVAITNANIFLRT
jgi:hypothetical protein